MKWIGSASSGVPVTAGQAMLTGLPILVGVQMILGFFLFDFQAIPRVPLQVILGGSRRRKAEAGAGGSAIDLREGRRRRLPPSPPVAIPHRSESRDPR